MLTKIKALLKKIKQFKYLRMAIWIVILLLGALIFTLWHNGIAHTLSHEYAYERWQGDSETEFGQISVFASAGDSFTEEMIYGFRNNLADKLLKASLEMTDGNLIHDCWSGKSEKTLVSGQGKTGVSVYGVGGDFFDFHDFELLSGCFFDDSKTMADSVLLDETSAWVLFGSTNVAGLTVEIDEIPYFVSGVYKQCEDKYTKKTKDQLPIVFMDYRAFQDDPNFRINCYEVLLPEVVDGFSQGLVKETLGMDSVEYVDHRLRFTMGVSFVNIPGYAFKSIRTTSVYYPYWENAARILKDKQILLCTLRWACLIFPIGCAIFFGIKLIKYVRKNIKWPKLPFRT